MQLIVNPLAQNASPGEFRTFEVEISDVPTNDRYPDLPYGGITLSMFDQSRAPRFDQARFFLPVAIDGRDQTVQGGIMVPDDIPRGLYSFRVEAVWFAFGSDALTSQTVLWLLVGITLPEPDRFVSPLVRAAF